MWFVAIVIFTALVLTVLSRKIFQFLAILNSIEPLHRKYNGKNTPIAETNNKTLSQTEPINEPGKIKIQKHKKEKDNAICH